MKNVFRFINEWIQKFYIFFLISKLGFKLRLFVSNIRWASGILSCCSRHFCLEETCATEDRKKNIFIFASLMVVETNVHFYSVIFRFTLKNGRIAKKNWRKWMNEWNGRRKWNSKINRRKKLDCVCYSAFQMLFLYIFFFSIDFFFLGQIWMQVDAIRKRPVCWFNIILRLLFKQKTKFNPMQFSSVRFKQAK